MKLIAICAGAAAACMHILGRRLKTAEDELASIWNGAADKELRSAVMDYCRSAVQSDLLAAASSRGIGSIPVRYRNHQDRFRTVGELMSEMAAKSGSRSYADLVRMVRWFYQLDYSLVASSQQRDRVLMLLERLLQANGTQGIGRIERVKSGQRNDPQIMMPVSNGTHVEQPFGFVVYSKDGGLMSRAEVLCR
jgi:hypothetical protein